MRGIVFSLISGQRIVSVVSQVGLVRFLRDTSKQLIENEPPFVGLFKLVHHYGTLGTRGFSRVRREFSVLAEGAVTIKT